MIFTEMTRDFSVSISGAAQRAPLKLVDRITPRLFLYQQVPLVLLLLFHPPHRDPEPAAQGFPPQYPLPHCRRPFVQLCPPQARPPSSTHPRRLSAARASLLLGLRFPQGRLLSGYLFSSRLGVRQGAHFDRHGRQRVRADLQPPIPRRDFHFLRA